MLPETCIYHYANKTKCCELAAKAVILFMIVSIWFAGEDHGYLFKAY